mmetsp:Transcript_67068/g.207863  ORF Transcript_67068/g.207863 Transcript_67068/m.207863 type:complete len:128 (-) Transcript_67068:693-1076(-)
MRSTCCTLHKDTGQLNFKARDPFGMFKLLNRGCRNAPASRSWPLAIFNVHSSSVLPVTRGVARLGGIFICWPPQQGPRSVEHDQRPAPSCKGRVSLVVACLAAGADARSGPAPLFLRGPRRCVEASW